MTNISEIEQRIDKQIGEWYQKVFDAKLPDTFRVVFKRCVLNVPPVLHNMPAKYLRELTKKPFYELTRADVAVMLQIIFNSPIGHYDEDEDKVFDVLEELGKIRSQYNSEVKRLAEEKAKQFRKEAAQSGIVMDKSTASYQPKIQVV